MTLKEFINNPAGKGDSSVNRATLISVLDSKYDKLVKEEEQENDERANKSIN